MIRKLSENLKQQADKARDSVASASDKLKEIGQSGTEQALDLVSLFKDKVNEVKDAGFEKLKAGIDELSSGMPLIEQAGFEVKDVTIGLGIPPEVVITFKKHRTVSSEDIEQLIEANADKKILGPILQALLTANNIQSKITMGRFKFSGVAIKVGIPPEVSLRYD